MAQAQTVTNRVSGKVVNISTGRRFLLKNVNVKALAGNGNRKLKHVCSDLLNKMQGDDKDVAIDCELHHKTVERMRECDSAYQPRAQTLEKIIKACGAYVEIKQR